GPMLPSPSSPWIHVGWPSTGAAPTGPPSPILRGTSVAPAAARMRAALAAATSTATFPCTAVTAATAMAGDVSAHHSATASSTPGSVSMMTGMVTRPSQPADVGERPHHHESAPDDEILGDRPEEPAVLRVV